MSVPDWMIDVPTPRVDDMATLIRRLVRELRKAAPSNDLAEKALDYLKRMGLGADVMRSGAAPVQVAPADWKLVPVEPTIEMREAFHDANDEFEEDNGEGSPDFQWAAMLAAAPIQPGAAADDARDAATIEHAENADPVEVAEVFRRIFPVEPVAGGRREVKKVVPGDELHLTILGVPYGFNFLMGKDRQDMLAFGRAVWDAALSTPAAKPAEEQGS